MNVLVVGGTGFIGSALCGELRERGHTVAALSRNPGTGGLPAGVEKVVGDVDAYDSIVSAFDGRDVVVNLVALSPLFQPSGSKSHMGVHYEGTKNVVKAAKAKGVPKIVQMSALGADPDGSTEYLRAKGLAEEAVAESGLDYVTFRPSVVFGDGGEFISFTKRLKRMFAPGAPIYPLPGGGTNRFQPIWVGDLAPMLADAVEADDHDGETYEIGGPERISLADVARMAFEADGTSISIVGLPMSLADIGLTVLGAVGGPMGPDQARSLRIDNVTDDNDVEAFGVTEAELTTLSQYLGLESADTAADGATA